VYLLHHNFTSYESVIFAAKGGKKGLFFTVFQLGCLQIVNTFFLFKSIIKNDFVCTLYTPEFQ